MLQNLKLRICLVGLVGLSPMVFAWVTGNVWEDFFITFRCSLNLANGNGLVYEAGRTLHVFTSPLGVLLPAGIAWSIDSSDPVTVLWGFRILSAFALMVGWWYTSQSIKDTPPLAVAAVLWILDPKLAAYATNGMETAFVVLFVMLAWHALLENKFNLAGIALAGTLWARPDGFIFFGVIAIATVLVPQGPRPRWQDWLRVAVVGALIYTPWFVWAWTYYGSPIPNTILAKSGSTTLVDRPWEAVRYPFDLLFGFTANHEVFLPPYYYFGAWSKHLQTFGKVITIIAVIPAFWPRCHRFARVASIAFLLGGIYLELTTRAPWYYPAWAVLGYLAIAGLFVAGWEKLQFSVGRRLLSAGASLLIIIQATMLICVGRQLQEQQRIIEWGLRAQIGYDLKAMARSPLDTVFLEPLGYIGYFSELSMRDTPGLSSPEVIALRQEGIYAMPEIIHHLKPDWVVMRFAEYLRFDDEQRGRLDATFVFRKAYNATDEIAAVNWLPGRGFLNFDARFGIWQRVSDN